MQTSITYNVVEVFYMKKYIFEILFILFFPVGITLCVCIFSSQIYLGMGSSAIEDHLMGRSILLETKGLYKDVDVEEYVLGVMAGSIPPNYDMEALKVQAVLIRTNVLKEMEEENSADSADLSYTYYTSEERRELWGENKYGKYEKRMERAVALTAGEVLRYEDALIMAVYHEVSIGKTAGAKEILGEDISYLKSVDSSQDVEAKHYMNIVSYSKDELKELLNGNGNKEKTEENEKETGDIEIKIDETSKNGFVKKITVNGKTYSGEEAMELFSLPSLNFYVEEIGEDIRFVCLGKGNCMGVSLYGANYMAQNGSTMEDIISHYYQNVSLEPYIQTEH